MWMLLKALLFLGITNCNTLINTPPEVVICAIVKNEEIYLNEWITYHRGLGFNHIYLMDNSDNNTLNDLNRTHSDVTVFHAPGDGLQLQSYYDFVEAFRGFDLWAAFIDADEFLVLKNHMSIQALISSCCISSEDNVIAQEGGALSINWVMFGSNHHTEYLAKPVTQRFTARAARLDPHVKTIAYLPHIDAFYNCHNPKLLFNKQQIDTRGVYFTGSVTNHTPPLLVEDEVHAVLHHYFTKSEEEFRLKISRGRSDIVNERRTMIDFVRHDINDVYDSSAWDFYQTVLEAAAAEEEAVKTNDTKEISTTRTLDIENDAANVVITTATTAVTGGKVDTDHDTDDKYAVFNSLFNDDQSSQTQTQHLETESPSSILYTLAVSLDYKVQVVTRHLVIYEHQKDDILLTIIRFCIDNQIVRHLCVALTNALLSKYELSVSDTEQADALFESVFALNPDPVHILTSTSSTSSDMHVNDYSDECVSGSSTNGQQRHKDEKSSDDISNRSMCSDSSGQNDYVISMTGDEYKSPTMTQHKSSDDKRMSPLRYEVCHQSYWSTTSTTSQQTSDKNTGDDTAVFTWDNKNVHLYIISHDDKSQRIVYDTLHNISSNTTTNANRKKPQQQSVAYGGLLPPSISSIHVRTTIFFEYLVYRDVLPFLYHSTSAAITNGSIIDNDNSSWEDVTYVVITTYKTFARYPALCHSELIRLLAIAAKHQYDVVPLIRSDRSLIVSATFAHGRAFRYAWNALLQELGYDLPTIHKYDHIHPFYRNSLIITRHWLKKLCQFMSKAMDAVLMTPQLIPLFAHSGRYEDNGDETIAYKVFNSSSYQLHPFVFERLAAFYFAVEGAKVCHGVDTHCVFNTKW